MAMRDYIVDMAFIALQWTGKIPSRRLRRFVYSNIFGMRIDSTSVVYNNCQIRAPKKVKIGKYCAVGDQCILDGRGGITLGDNVNLSTSAWLWSMQHDPQKRDFGVKSAPITIGDHAWISSRVTILPGVSIGRGAVVAAHAVVTKDVAEFTIVGGIPARKIGERTRDLNYQLDAVMHFW